MPVVRYEIRNEYGLGDPDLYGAAESDDPEALLEGVAMAGLVGVLRQLGDLAEFAGDIFNDLHEEVMATSARGHTLMLRVQQLEAEFPAIEKAVLSQTSHSHLANTAGIDWHPNNQLEENLITQGGMPRFILNSYEKCLGLPQLFTLDKFDVAGAGACLKRYSDPSFFRTDFAPSGRIETQLQREKKNRKIKRKGTRWRNGETLESLMKPDNETKILISRKNPESLSLRRAKLKKRPVSSFATRIGRSYMECILDRKLPDQIGGNSLSNFQSNKTSDDPDPEIHEIMVDTSSRKPFSRGTEQSHNSTNKNITEEHTDEIRKHIVMGDIPKPFGVSTDKVNKFSSFSGNDTAKYSSRDTIQKTDDHSSELKNTGAIKCTSKTDCSGDAGLSDDVVSEFENYVDALTTMDSEMETDTESKVQQERDILITKLKSMNPVSDVDLEEPKNKYSNLPAFNGLSNEMPSIGIGELPGDFAETNLSRKDETNSDHTSLPENVKKLLNNHQDTSCLSLQENMPITPSEFSEYMIEKEGSNSNVPDTSGIVSESASASDNLHAAGSTLSGICSSPQEGLGEVQQIDSYLGCDTDKAICEPYVHSVRLITEEEQPHNVDLNTQASTINASKSLDSNLCTGGIELLFRSVEDVDFEKAETSNMSSDGIEDFNSMLTYTHHGNELCVECPVETYEDAETMTGNHVSLIVKKYPVFESSSAERSQNPLLNSVEERKEIFAAGLEKDDGKLEVIHLDRDSKFPIAETLNEKTGEICGSSTQILDIQEPESKPLPATEDQEFHDAEDHPGLPTTSMPANITVDTCSVQKISPSFHVETKSNSVGVVSDAPTSVSSCWQSAPVSESKIQEEIVSHELNSKEISKPNKAVVLISEETCLLLDVQKEDTEISTPKGICFEEEDKINALHRHNNGEKLDHGVVDSPGCSTSLMLNNSPQNGFLDDANLSMNHSDASGFDMVLLDLKQVPDVNHPIFSSSHESSSSGSVVDHCSAGDNFSKTPRDVFGGFESQQQLHSGNHAKDETKEGSSKSWLDSNITVSVHAENGEQVLQNTCVEQIFHSSDSSPSESNCILNDDMSVQAADCEQEGIQNRILDSDNIFSIQDLDLEKLVCKTSTDSTCMSPVISANMESLSEIPNSLQRTNLMDKTPSLDNDTMDLQFKPLVSESQKNSWETVNTNNTKGFPPYDAENRNQSEAEASTSLQPTCDMFVRSHKNIKKLDIEKKNVSVYDPLVAEACNAQQASSQQELESHLLPNSSNVLVRCAKDINKLDTSPRNTSDSYHSLEVDNFVSIGFRTEISPTSLGSKSDALCLTSLDFPPPTTGTAQSFFPKSGNLGQSILDDPPPLPPLPPLQWRLGKPRAGPKVIQSATKAESNYHHLDISSEQSHGDPKLPGQETLYRNSIVDGTSLEEQTLFASKHDNMEGIYDYRMIRVEGEMAHRSKCIDDPAYLEDDKYLSRQAQSVSAHLPNQFDLVQVPHNNMIENASFDLVGEQKEPLEPMMSGKDAPQVDVPLSENQFVKYSSPLSVASIGDDNDHAQHNRDLELEKLESSSLFMSSPAMHEVTMQDNVFMSGYEDFYSTYPAISSFGSNHRNGRTRSILNRPRDPLIEAVASHDKSTLRKVSEMEKTSVKPKADERNTLLEQIRNKSFNLKPAVAAKPKVNRPATNLKLAAILEKANAIRQAFVGSDEDDDNWSDC